MSQQPATSPVSPADGFIEHLRDLACTSNEFIRSIGLPIELDVNGAIAAVQNGTAISKVAMFTERADDTGILHKEQLFTALAAIKKILDDPQRAGLILGAMQSGKTTTGLALQFAGPIYYLLTGRPLFPFYLLTAQTSHESQTTHELQCFFQFYGDIAFRVVAPHVQSAYLDKYFTLAPTLQTYRDRVLAAGINDIGQSFTIFQGKELIWRRAMGKNLTKIANMIERLAKMHFFPLMIIDEPQFGASDRIYVDPDGTTLVSKCVFNQLFDDLSARLNVARGQHVFVALSATPYELVDVDSIWLVAQHLGEAYSGFNFCAGQVISETEDFAINPPTIKSMSDFATDIEVPFLEKLSFKAYFDAHAFEAMHKRLDYDGDHDAYKAACEKALIDMLLALAIRHDGEHFGVCIRTVNDNGKVDDLVKALSLTGIYDVIPYYGSDAKGKSVKAMLAEHSSKERPYVLLVTNRARMGDAFPATARYFIEFTNKFTDLNSMMQGLVGRACGYGKKSTVVLSEMNAMLLRAVIETKGQYIIPASRHSIVAGGAQRRGPGTVILRLPRNPEDPIVEAFFKRLDDEVVKEAVMDGPKLRTRRGDDRRTGPMLQIAHEVGLFPYLESDEGRSAYFPNFQKYQIARKDDRVPDQRRIGRYLQYALDDDGNCRLMFRELKNDFAHGGLRARGRSKGQSDEQRDEKDYFLEPQILMQKYDPVTGKAILDYDIEDSKLRAPGSWRAVGIVLPLVAPVREFVAGEAAYPRSACTFDPYLQGAQRDARDEAEEAERIAKEQAAFTNGLTA